MIPDNIKIGVRKLRGSVNPFTIEDTHITLHRLFRRLKYSRTVSVDDYVDMAETALILNVGLRHVYRLVDGGKLKTHKGKGKGREFMLCSDVLKYKYRK